MIEAVKVYRQSLPAVRFIGKKYGDSDRVNGGFGQQWGEWFAKGWFEKLDQIGAPATYEDRNATLGLMRWKDGDPFEYWIGKFCHPDAAVPDGYDFVDFPASDLGIVWVRGKESEIYCKEDECAGRCKAAGYRIAKDPQGACWGFERYVCPRFTTPDAEGKIILDIGIFIDPA